MQVGLEREVIKGVSYGHAAKKVSSLWQRLADHLGFCSVLGFLRNSLCGLEPQGPSNQ